MAEKREIAFIMPTIEVLYGDLENLSGRKLSIHNLKEESLLFAKSEFDGQDGDIIKIDVKDTNRPDLWSAEGIARCIQGAYNKKIGCPKYNVRKSNYIVKVDSNLKKIRPRTACAVVKGINITDEILSQIIQLQEKVAGTFGRKRKEAAIGVYDFDKIKWPIAYKAFAPDELKFIPLEYDYAMSLKQILRQHPKGVEFTYLLKDKAKYPIFIDAENNVLSMPPIINSDYSGKITENTKNLFIEVSGFDDKFIQPALNVIVAALADRGGKLYEVIVDYGLTKLKTPNLKPKKFKVKINSILSIAGFSLTKRNIVNLLKRARYNAKVSGKFIEVEYPAYRQDLMHEVDVIEDILIVYGYNNICPEIPKLPVRGEENLIIKFSRLLREYLVGFGAQEIATFSLTNKNNLFEKMNLKNQRAIEIANPISLNWSTLRTWLLPGVIGFLSNNTKKEFPQVIFEVGECVTLNPEAETKTDTITKLAFCVTHSKVTFTEIKQILNALLVSLNLNYKIEEMEHSSFISGRCGVVKVKNTEVGIIGEIHPQVLNNWKLENPVGAFELNINKLYDIIKKL